MSQIRKRSLKAATWIYVGFLIGALNTYLLTHKNWFEPDQYGLTQSLVQIGLLVFAFSTLGVTSYLYKFFPYYQDNLKASENDILGLALRVAIGGFVPVSYTHLDVYKRQANSYTISGQTLNVSQGYIDPVYGIDAAIKKDLLKNKAASITLQVIDIFKMRKYETYSNSSYFSQHNSRQRDSQVFRLNLNWHFGKVDVALFKRKNSKADNEVLPGLQVGTR